MRERTVRDGFVPIPLARTLVRLLLRPALGPRLTYVGQRRALSLLSAILARAPGWADVERTEVGGVPAERIRFGNESARERTVLYLHGGGYCLGSPATHRLIAAYLARSAEAEVVLPDYRRAPEHPFPAALDDALRTYEILAERNNVAIAGDSAGGGLAVSLAVAIRANALPTPSSLLLLSPWTDLALTGESLAQKAKVDPVLQVEQLRTAAGLYTAGRAPTDPAISPLYADLTGLPPVLLHVGADEILLSDSQRLAERLTEAGVDVDLRVYERLWHVFATHAGLLPQATRALTDAGRFIRENGDGTARYDGPMTAL